MASGWTVWRLDTGTKSDSEERSQDGGNNGTTWGDITRKRNANRGVELTRLKEMYGEEIISAVIP